MDLETRAEELRLVALKRIAGVHGLSAKIYRRLGLFPSRGGCRAPAVSKNWPNGIPMDHVFIVSAVSRIPPEELRPDVFLHDPLRREAAIRYCRTGPPAPKPRQPPRKYQRVTNDAHKALWLDLETYPTVDAAVAAVSASMGRSVDRASLYRCFGPRVLARWRPPTGTVLPLNRWSLRPSILARTHNISNA